MIFVRFILLIVLTSVLLPPVAAQQRDQKTNKKPAVSRENEELRLSAVSLLHSLTQSANEVEKLAERVRVLADIGDAFWSVDADHARAVLLRSFKEIDKLSADNDSETVASEKRELRNLVLSRIAKHEPALANQLVQELTNEKPTRNEKFMREQGIASPNAEALLGIADSVLDSDTKRAAALAVYSLQDGLSQQLRLFLIRLRAKDPVAADGLFAAALSEASKQHPGRLFDVLILWDYAYQPQDFYFNGISWLRENDEPRFMTSVDLRRMVLSFAVTAIVENLQQIPPSGDTTQDRNLVLLKLGGLHSVIQQILPNMQADWPRGTPDLQQALVRVEQELRVSGQSAPIPPPSEDPAGPTNAINRLLEKAAEAPQGEGRDNLYLGAAAKCLPLGRYEKGKEIAAKIDDVEKRAMVLEPLNFSLAGELIEKKNLQEALTVANQIKTAELRIVVLARLGRAFIDAGDSQSGVLALNAAQSLASKADPSIEVAAAALRIAAAFAKRDPIRTTEAITLAIQITNKVRQDETPWILLSSVAAEDRFNLTWRNTGDGGVSFIKATLPAYGGLVDLLSKMDFNEAISLAKTINNKSLSLTLQAVICRKALEFQRRVANPFRVPFRFYVGYPGFFASLRTLG
ncbi:MAG TPA: hypothetical protein VLB46_14185 [Pyrinomonadaceae bacterium]|nr:hypothetical protein [Pyrinomonadaceae bacterium]